MCTLGSVQVRLCSNNYSEVLLCAACGCKSSSHAGVSSVISLLDRVTGVW